MHMQQTCIHIVRIVPVISLLHVHEVRRFYYGSVSCTGDITSTLTTVLHAYGMGKTHFRSLKGDCGTVYTTNADSSRTTIK